MAEIFNVTHEGGNLSEYNSISGSGPSASMAAAMCGSWGMAVALSGANTYAEKTFTALSNASYRLRLYFDVNSLTMADGDDFEVVRMFNGSNLRLQLRLIKSGSDYQLRTVTTRDNGTTQNGGLVTITDAPHRIEMVVNYASSSSANNATCQLYVDGSLVITSSAFDLFDLSGPDRIRLGGTNGVDSGTSGTLYVDDIILRDDTVEIGECSAGGAMQPAWAMQSNQVIQS